MKKLLLFLFVNSLTFSLIFAQLSGIKTVGDGGDYAALADAVLDVNTNGLNGNTVFEIKNSYDKTEFLYIKSYPGNNQYTLTIRPEAGATEVTLRGAGGSMIMLDSANHVIIDGRPGGVTDTCVLRFLHSNKGNSSTCWVYNSKNIIIRNCYIRFDGTRAVSLQGSDSCIVEKCDVATYTTGPTSNGATIGIESNISFNSVIRNNSIHDLLVGTEFWINAISIYCTEPEISNDSIYNNFITLNDYSADSLADITGIRLFNDSANFYIYFNSIYIAGENIKGKYSFGLSCEGTKSLDLKNNIILNERSNGIGDGQHYGINLYYLLNNENISSDNNDIFCNGIGGIVGSFGGWGKTLTEWQVLSGWDLNSVSEEVVFAGIETGDLHLAGSSLTDTALYGLYMAGINDIDNEERRADGTFMGADQPPFFEPCIPGTTTDPENIIENGDFGDCMLAPWFVYIETINGTAANAVINDGQFSLSGITIANAPEYWQLQLLQVFTDVQIGKLTAGEEYILSFDAWSETGSRPCHLSFGQSEFPYDDMLNQFITIDAVHRSYSYEFLLSTIYEHKMRLALDFGTDATPITLDNIRLVKKAVNSLPGINEERTVKIMPNPATDFIQIDAQDGSTACLFNNLGMLVRVGTISNGQIIFDITDLSRGIYLVNVSSNKNVITDKVIVQ